MVWEFAASPSVDFRPKLYTVHRNLSSFTGAPCSAWLLEMILGTQGEMAIGNDPRNARGSGGSFCPCSDDCQSASKDGDCFAGLPFCNGQNKGIYKHERPPRINGAAFTFLVSSGSLVRGFWRRGANSNSRYKPSLTILLYQSLTQNADFRPSKNTIKNLPEFSHCR